MGKLEKTIFSLCLLITLLVLTIALCWVLSRQSGNVEYILEDFEKKTISREMKVSHDFHEKAPKKELMQAQCSFGIDFISSYSGGNTTRTGPRYRLPNHKKKNFTGTLLGPDLQCLDTMDANVGEGLGIFECHGQGRNQAMTFTTSGLIVSHAKIPMCAAMKDEKALTVVLKTCNAKDQTQIWKKDSIKGHIFPALRKEYCVTAPAHEGLQLFLKLCADLEVQRWRLVMNEVMLLAVEGAPTNPKTLKIKRDARKQLSKMILHGRQLDVVKNTLASI